jgi:hypothetical protein
MSDRCVLIVLHVVHGLQMTLLAVVRMMSHNLDVMNDLKKMDALNEHHLIGGLDCFSVIEEFAHTLIDW